MSDQAINYEAVLADLEARRAQLDSAIAAIRQIMGQLGGVGLVPPASGASVPSGTLQHDAFIGMSIPEAAKKYLASVRRKLSTQDLMTALEAGGLPPSKYGTVYAILRRREKQVGDIINMKGDWGLTEWYPNHRKKSSSSGNDESEEDSTESNDDNSVTA
jgi:hypothetical protein